MRDLFRKAILFAASILVSSAISSFAPAQSLPYATVPPPGAAPRSLPFDTAAGPKATHRFWAAKNWYPVNLTGSSAPYTMFAEPLAFQATPAGLLVGYSPNMTVGKTYFIHPWQPAFTLGTEGMRAQQIPVSGYTDWTVDLNFGTMTARLGRGMPFVYAMMTGDPTLTFVSPPTVFSSAGNVLGVSVGGSSYGLFCPTDGRWTQTPTVFTCHLPPGKNYFSVALLPEPAALPLFQQHAYSFPQSTRVSWAYDEQSSQVTTSYEVTTSAMEGAETGFLQALYPHQYASLAGSAINTQYGYISARGTLKVMDRRSFTTRDTYHGVLPFLPLPRSTGVQERMQQLLRQVRSEQSLFAARDTYGVGKNLGRIAQLLPLAEMGNDDKSLRFFSTAMKSEFEQWFRNRSPQTLPTFFYDRDWSTLIGYPAAFGSDDQLNDHHFHYGYWIHAAALLALYDPEWLQSSQAGAGIAMLAGDIATPRRNDSMFPFLRHFDVYAGHSWASGQAPFGDGENEESSSEAINAWAGLILYASEKNDLVLRDTAIWMYTLETNAAFDYWFNDGPVKTFPKEFNGEQIANLFDGKSDAATWFGDAPAMEHGIEFLPFTGASLYLGRDRQYVRRNLEEVTKSSAGKVDTTSSSWPDLMEMYEAFDHPDLALSEWNHTSFVNDGETRAHEYGWLQSLGWLGTVDTSVTANTPFYAVLRSTRGVRNHLAFNLSSKAIQVTFSDGFQEFVPASTLCVNGMRYSVRHLGAKAE